MQLKGKDADYKGYGVTSIKMKAFKKLSRRRLVTVLVCHNRAVEVTSNIEFGKAHKILA